MPTVSQHYGRHAAPRTGDDAQTRRQVAAPVVLMVSGGADSTALLLMACTSKLDIQDGRGVAPIARERLHVLHVNHHLRGESSDGDEAFVRDLCAQYGLPLCVEHAYFDDESGNIEAAAREVRYTAARRYVRELCAQTGAPRTAARICTAHTSSDRAETFLMNAIKGSGPAGLSSIPRRRNIVVRPLLDLTHDELVSYLQVHGQPWREDESNEDISYLRNYVRHRVMPVVAQRNASVCKTIGAACEILGDEDAFLSQLSAQAFRSCLRKEAAGALVLDARPEMRHVERVLACVAEGAGSVTLPAGIDARVEFGMLAFKAPVAREGLLADWITIPGRLPLGAGRILVAEPLAVEPGCDIVRRARELAAAGEVAAMVDAAALGFADRDSERMLAGSRGEIPAEARSARLWVDGPAPGDVMCPLGMSGRSKKVSDLLNEARIPVSERASVPVVRTAPGGSVVWVAGVRADERFKCTAATRVAYLLRVVDAE